MVVLPFGGLLALGIFGKAQASCLYASLRAFVIVISLLLVSGYGAFQFFS